MTSLKLIMGTFSYAVQPAIRSLRKVLLLAAGCLELPGFLTGLALRQVVHDRRTYEH